jgi:2-dehydro-3-deoxyphosphogluconate aldolase/(4S)-4-hydroxy-2-oxoglutarate aldolase
MKTFNEIVYDSGVMPILFSEPDCAETVIKAIEQTETPVVEILQRGDLAKSVLKEACRIKKTAYVGAGTICNLEQCKEAVDLGADFIVSPGYDRETVKWCVKNGIPVVPGVSTTSEVMDAVNNGATLLKAFPFNEHGGLPFFSSIAGPFPDVSFIATGCLDDRDLHLVSSPRIAAVGGVWMFQGETDHTLFPIDEIVRRLNISISIGKHYRNGWN